MPPTMRGLKRAASMRSIMSKRRNFGKQVQRQKGLCWFCNERMGFDCTKEHVKAKARGGDDRASNIVAAHGDCNGAAGHLPVSDKERIRAVGHMYGRKACIDFAHELRRADTRLAFLIADQDPEYRQRQGFRRRKC